MFKKTLKLNILAIFLAVFMVFSALDVEKTESQTVLPIGGQIYATYYCCTGIMLTLGPPKPGTYMYYWGTPLYAHYDVFEPGPYVLGRGFTGGYCAFPESYCIAGTATTGFFTMVGTSPPPQ